MSLTKFTALHAVLENVHQYWRKSRKGPEATILVPAVGHGVAASSTSCVVTELVAAQGQAGSTEIKHAIFACGALSKVRILPLKDI